MVLKPQGNDDHEARKPGRTQSVPEVLLGSLSILILLAIGFTAVMTFATPARGHPGGLAADGCHNDRKAGTRHCHRPQTRQSSPPRKSTQGGSVYYSNCAEARAAGAAPVRRGQPGYAPHLDRDNDGIGCE